MKKGIIPAIAAAVILLSLLLSHAGLLFAKPSPAASQGVMDLSGWNFDKDGAVSLGGEWECYDGQLLTPADFHGTGSQKPRLTGYSDLTAGRLGNPSLRLVRPEGVRTYRLIVKTGAKPQNLGLQAGNIRMSSRIYVDGVLQGSVGAPAERNRGYRAQAQSNEAYFRSRGGQTEILLQTANFDYPFYGTQYILLLGRQKEILSSAEMQGALELCGAVMCFLFGFFYLCLFLAGKDRGMLFAAGEFFSLALSISVAGEKMFYSFFPLIPFGLFGKIQAVCIYAVDIFIVAYARALDRTFLSDRFAAGVYAGGAAYFIFVLLTPASLYLRLNGIYFCAIVGILLYFLPKLWHRYRTMEPSVRRKETVLYLFCVASLLIAFTNAFLCNFSWTSSIAVGSVAACLFILLSMASIAFRFIVNYDSVVRMDRVKNEFVTRSSHQLKAPLNSIRSICEASLSDGSFTGDSCEKMEKRLKSVKGITERLLYLVDSIYDATFLQNGQLKLHRDPVDLGVAARMTADNCRRALSNPSVAITVRFDRPCVAFADESRVRQILWNLIDNSAWSMEQGGIFITGSAAGDTVSIDVRDGGCGIPQNRRDRIFDAYTSFDSRGMGLGLYLSRLLAEAMGGSLILKWSEVGRGSCFELSLPRSSLRAGRLHKVRQLPVFGPLLRLSPGGREHREKTGDTVLIVDGDREDVQAASYLLRRNGYGVLTAYSGSQAAHAIRAARVDLVILSTALPGGSGLSVCREIRKKYSLIELPVLISTVGNSSDDLDLGLAAGANDFISKPFTGKKLLARVRTLTALKRASNEAIRSRLAFLQAQIKPHFLYNAINTIISFCYTDGERAASLLANFSKYLRLTFDVEGKTYFEPLWREIELIRAFLEIEQARFGEKIRVSFEIDEELKNFPIPPLILQPLVENAVSHGLRNRPEGGLVTVCARRSGGKTVFSVRDTGVGMPPEQVERLQKAERVNGGVGFANVCQRVRHWENARITVCSTVGKGTVVTITVGR